MGQVSAKLRSWAGDEKSGFMFFCPGCNCAHAIHTSPGGWSFDGNLDAPTFTPSVLVTTGHYVPDFAARFPPGAEIGCWCTYNLAHPEDPGPPCTVCHSFVRGGMIEFLGDCTHKLAGQTVPLPDWPAHYAGGDLPELT